MAPDKFKVVPTYVRDTGEAPRAADIYYRCTDCGESIPSQPRDNILCSCGNICIDNEYVRLVVIDFNKFEVVHKIG